MIAYMKMLFLCRHVQKSFTGTPPSGLINRVSLVSKNFVI